MPSDRYFIDTNIFLRHLLQDHEEQSRKASRYLSRLDAGEFQAETGAAVIGEVVFTMVRGYKIPRLEVASVVGRMVSSAALHLPGKQVILAALELSASLNIPYVDALNVVEARRSSISTIVSFDRDFDRVPGLRRVEPDDDGLIPTA